MRCTLPATLAGLILALVPAASAAVFHVAPNGRDANPGTPTKPFRTLPRAQRAVRAADRTADATVILHGGTYRLDGPLVFGPEDGGTGSRRVTWKAAPGEIPVLNGGRKITGWAKGERGVWIARLPEAAGTWQPRQLFVNGVRRTRARTPNEGFFTVDGPITQDAPSVFRPRPGDIRREWVERGDVEMVALQKWAELIMPLKEIREAAADGGPALIALSGTTPPSNREDNARYWLENAPDMLDAPGEFHVNRDTGIISYIPMPGENLSTATVAAPRLKQLVRVEGDPNAERYVRNLHFEDLVFTEADWSLPAQGYGDVQAAHDISAVLDFRGALGCSVTDCAVRRVGTWAISFGEGCRNNTVSGCQLSDLGAGGVKLGEPTIRRVPGQITGHNTVTDCRIHDIGRVYPAAVGVWIGQSAGNAVSHNEIHDTYYTAISVGWTWGYGETLARDNTIANNHLHDIGSGMLSDMGGIYLLGVQPGTVVRGNVLHDISSHTYGGWGIYTDEGSSEILIEGNLVYRTKTGGFHQHYGRENTVRNNIFALAKEGQVIRTRPEEHLSFTFEQNIVYWTEGPLLGSNWSGENYRLDRNLYWNPNGGEVRFAQWSFDEWQARGQDRDSQIADPLFLDPAKGDFRLKPGSPALAMGFRPIDPSAAGPRPRR